MYLLITRQIMLSFLLARIQSYLHSDLFKRTTSALGSLPPFGAAGA